MDKLFVKSLGWTVGFITRSNASTPLLVLYVFISLFSLGFRQYDVWVNISYLFAVAFILVIIFLPNRLRSEKYNLENKKMDLLGEKGRKFELTESTEVFQPINFPKKGEKK